MRQTIYRNKTGKLISNNIILEKMILFIVTIQLHNVNAWRDKIEETIYLGNLN